MKTLNPNLVFNQPDATYPFGKLIKTMKQPLLLMFVLFLCAASHAQQAQLAPAIKHLDAFLASVPTNGQSASRPERLIKEIQSAVYYDGAVTLRGNNPVILFTSASSMNSITSMSMSSFDASKIEMITIRVSEASQLSGGLDMSAFAGFPNLKYVYILSEVSVQLIDITRSVRNNNPNYSVFYSVSKPS